MKYFFNSLFLLGILTYIGAGTVPVWSCLKENKLTLSHHCTEKEEKNSCCSAETETEKSKAPKLGVVCCELLDQPWTDTVKKSIDQDSDNEKTLILAYKSFYSDLSDEANPSVKQRYKDAPKRGSPPLYKIHSSYLC